MESNQYQGQPETCSVCTSWPNYEFNTAHDDFGIVQVLDNERQLLEYLKSGVRFPNGFLRQNKTINLCEVHFVKDDLIRGTDFNGEACVQLVDEETKPSYMTPEAARENNRIHNLQVLMDDYQNCLNLEGKWRIEGDPSRLALKSETNLVTLQITADQKLTLVVGTQIFTGGSILESCLENNKILYWSRLRALMNFCEENSPLQDVLIRLGASIVTQRQQEETIEGFTKTDDGLFVCKYCAYKTDKINKLNNHLKYHASAPVLKHLCNICLKPQPTPYHVKRHIKSNHPGAEYTMIKIDPRQNINRRPSSTKTKGLNQKDLYQCAHCKYATGSKDCLRNHVVYHTTRYMCHICSKCFPGSFHLTRHLEKVHPNSFEEEQAKSENMVEHIDNGCGLWGFDFSNVSYDLPGMDNLIMMTGTKNDPKHFNLLGPPVVVSDSPNKTDIPKDFKVVMADSGEKIYCCPECPYQGKKKRLLQLHMIYHTDKFQCKICNKRNPTAYHLERHVSRIHGKKSVVDVNNVDPDQENISMDFDELKMEPECNIIDESNDLLVEEVVNVSSESSAEDYSDPLLKCVYCEYTTRSRKLMKAHTDSHSVKKNYILPEVTISKKDNTSTWGLNLTSTEIDANFSYDNELSMISNHFMMMNGSENDSDKIENSKNFDVVKSTNGETLYCCRECTYKGTKKRNLIAHLVYHTDRYQCNVCSKRHPTMFHLNRHMSKIHPYALDGKINILTNSLQDINTNIIKSKHEAANKKEEIAVEIKEIIKKKIEITKEIQQKVVAIKETEKELPHKEIKKSEVLKEIKKPEIRNEVKRKIKQVRKFKIKIGKKVQKSQRGITKKRPIAAKRNIKSISNPISNSSGPLTRRAAKKYFEEETSSRPKKVDDSKNFSCPKCSYKTTKQFNLKLHLVSHTDKFRCPECSKGQITSFHLNRHRKLCHGVKES